MSAVQMTVLMLNIVWFGAGAIFFALRPKKAIKILVPKSTQHEVSRVALEMALPFLGGMNLAFATLSAAVLASALSYDLSHDLSRELAYSLTPAWPIFFASAVAHGSQFASNVPCARLGGRAGGAPWDVLRGPMRFIFFVDAICCLANLLVLFSIVVERLGHR